MEEDDINIAASEGAGSSEGGKKKRSRLSCSCDRCRKRKIKCDEQQPRCSQCVKAGSECIVTKPAKNPFIEPVRRKTGTQIPVRQRKRAEKKAAKEAAKRAAEAGFDMAGPSNFDEQMPLTFENTAMLAGSSHAHNSFDLSNATTGFSGMNGMNGMNNTSGMNGMSGMNGAGAMFGLHQSPPASTPSSLGMGQNVSMSDAEALILLHHQPHSQQHQPQQQPQPSMQHHVSFAPSLHSTESSSAITHGHQGQQAVPEKDSPDYDHPGVNEPGLHHAHSSWVPTDGKKFCGPSSSQVFVKWLDEGSRSQSTLSSHLRFAVSRVEEIHFPGIFGPRMPLPPPATLTRYLDAYFRDIHPLFPVVDEASIRHLAANPANADPLSMTVMHLIVSQGADCCTPSASPSQDGSTFLQQAYMALPSVLARPFRTSLQILLLLAKGLRAHHCEGASWTFAGLAVRMAQSLGMHHHYQGETASLDARLFYAAYVLDKTSSFECGRPSAVYDLACTVHASSFTQDTLFTIPGRQPANLFGALVGIAKELSHISTYLFTRRATRLSTGEALRLVGEADVRLSQWLNALPVDLRPQADGSAPEDDILPYVTQIHCAYYLALITLHRLSLFDESVVHANLNMPALQPYASRLRSGAAICLSAARGMLSTLERLARLRPADRSWTCHYALTAIYVLAIRTYKQPDSWQAKADLMFLQHACQFTAQRCRELEYPEEFTKHVPKLYQKIEDKVLRPHLPSRPGTRPSSPTGTPSTASASTSNQPALQQQHINPNVPQAQGSNEMLSPDFEGVAINDLWQYILGDGSMEDPRDSFLDAHSFPPFGLEDQSDLFGQMMPT